MEGVFKTCPELRVALVEGGVAWLPGLLWRPAKNGRGCRMEVPRVDRPSSEIFAKHFRLTTQTSEEPPDPEHLMQIFEMIDAEHLLLFATDYPHWDFGAPERSLPRGLSEQTRERILPANAASCTGFPDARRRLRPQRDRRRIDEGSRGVGEQPCGRPQRRRVVRASRPVPTLRRQAFEQRGNR
jgi:hypothetical protein